VKKGRHRRYEEARNLKRGGDLDIEAIFNDLGSDRPLGVTSTDSDDSDMEFDEDADDARDVDRYDEEDYERG
jgi:hypothetical protein